MNREEQKQILGFIERAVTGRADLPLPALDLEADAIIRALFVRNPEAAYRITKLAMALEREVEGLRATGGVTAEARIPKRLGWFFARRKALSTGREPQVSAQVSAMEIGTNG